jgi:hypothetical protein
VGLKEAAFLPNASHWCILDTKALWNRREFRFDKASTKLKSFIRSPALLPSASNRNAEIVSSESCIHFKRKPARHCKLIKNVWLLSALLILTILFRVNIIKSLKYTKLNDLSLCTSLLTGLKIRWIACENLRVLVSGVISLLVKDTTSNYLVLQQSLIAKFVQYRWLV